jgi:folate-binding Fe-S cluster repair protein YgfZ
MKQSLEVNKQRKVNQLIAAKLSSSTAPNELVGFDLSNYRSLVAIRGNDSFKYLQNLVTNDMNSLNTNDDTTNKSAKSMYSMILNNRGRILYDV